MAQYRDCPRSETVLHHGFEAVGVARCSVVVVALAYYAFGSDTEIACEIVEAVDCGVSGVSVAVAA